MTILKSFWDHSYTFWALLCVPAVPMILGLSSGDPKAIHMMLHPTGEFAARFLIITLMITPLALLFKGRNWPRWMMKRRRYLGVAAFGYAALHTLLYLIDEGALAFTSAEISKLYIWTAWLAFFIFVPLAITSTDGWVRTLGRRWKTLQRLVYIAALFTLLHWAALHNWNGIAPALVHFLPLGLLETYRLYHFRNRLKHRMV